MVTISAALELIKAHKKVAIVGLSPKPERPSNKVGAFLNEKGLTIIPINPICDEILGFPCKASLKLLDKGEVDWIDLFVNPNRLLDMVDDIINLSPKLVWCQLGVINEEFNQKLEAANIPYIVDFCPKQEW